MREIKRISCPVCGRVFIKGLSGVLECNCPYCKIGLKIIADEGNITIFGEY
ncbi:hypothetical protein SAMN05421493_104144 [Pseudobutyrivibrio sp. 49]|uniref:hypothetical protein n=1 Tax=Pseudobutyrivibrio sp. 49 TaxID=1855344 RepID=UPI00088150E0|nr:hypothetical protein [Pseudobutyrivibrio sp. 49]SDH83074.1 hypothetical protein SAMN05421493_104144 [Pseudobutyrivibrio sp. 49]